MGHPGPPNPTRITDPLGGGYQWPPPIPEAFAKKEWSGNHKDGPLRAVLSYVT